MQEETTPLSPMLDTLVAAWMRTVSPAGCVLDLTPAPLPRISLEPRPVSCTHFSLHADDYGNGHGLAARKLGEFLRLIHASSARPQYVQAYDWLQQLLWPSVCTLPHCKCCRDGDRRVQVQLQRNDHESDSDPEMVYTALFKWNEEAASIEYKQLMAAIQRTSHGEGPTAPLDLIVTVKAPSAYQTEAYLASTKRLFESFRVSLLNRNSWFRLCALATKDDAERSGRVEFLDLLSCSKLPLALTRAKPMMKMGATNALEWLFGSNGSRPSRAMNLYEMPTIVELDLDEMGAPSERVLLDFCKWLAGNESLKALVLPLRSCRSCASSLVFEELGFALFSDLSKLKLDKLKLDVEILTDGDVQSLYRGEHRNSTSEIGKASFSASAQDGRHEALTLWARKTPVATSAKFFTHFGRHFRRLNLMQLMGGLSGEHVFQLVQVVLACCPQLDELIMAMMDVSDAVLDKPLDSESLHAITNLRSLTIVDHGDEDAGRAIARLLQLTGRALTRLKISAMAGSSAPFMDSILAWCPKLVSLDVGVVKVPLMGRLLRAYASGKCEISDLTLSIEGRCQVTMLNLLQTLSNPALHLSRTLRKLSFCGCYFPDDFPETFQAKQLKMLDQNPFLVETNLPLFDHHLNVARMKNGDIVSGIAYPLHPRQCAAVISCSPTVAHGLVPRDIWRLILAFSARPVRRCAVPLQ